jgi:hypothetical protein
VWSSRRLVVVSETLFGTPAAVTAMNAELVPIGAYH